MPIAEIWICDSGSEQNILLFALRLNLFAQNQSFSLASSKFTFWYKSVTSDSEKLAVVSSAKLSMFNSHEFGISFT